MPILQYILEALRIRGLYSFALKDTRKIIREVIKLTEVNIFRKSMQ